MFWKSVKLIYVITLISGIAGLIYEIVWTRMLLLVFGNSTHSVVAVISAFLGGLALGSLLIGHWCDKKQPAKLISIYTFLEFGIGITAILSLILLPLNNSVFHLISDGSSNSFILILIKFLLTSIVLLLPTTLMGGTLPVLVSILRHHSRGIDVSLSLLYSFNTFGAVLGVIIAAFFSIETFGLHNTLILGVFLNFLAGMLMSALNKNSFNKNEHPKLIQETKFSLNKQEISILVCFMLSGLISIAYEVLWTRVLTPLTGTFIYAFSYILIIYLFGIAAGSTFYNLLSKILKNRYSIFAVSELFIGIFALLSVFVISNYTEKNLLLVLLMILPASLFMGLSFPAANALFKQLHYSGKLIGISYFSNTIGSIIGGILASFLLIPLIGSSQSIIIMSICNAILAVILIYLTARKNNVFIKTFTVCCIIFIIFSGYLFIFKFNDFYESTTKNLIKSAIAQNAIYYYHEDDIASVFGSHNNINDDNFLMVDGVPITSKVPTTRLMAHIPVALHPNPQSLLDICFGMGSTFHSAMLHNISVDAVELSPSVVKMFPLFYPDAKDMLMSPKAQIIINDGRNYVNLTRKKYDIVTIDPPPPVNAAGTTVLYSEEFYKNILKIIKPQSIVSQWVYYGSRLDDINMIIKSYVNIFPYIIAVKALDGVPGVYLIGSLSPININDNRIDEVFSQNFVRDDLKQVNLEVNSSTFKSHIIGNKNSLMETLVNVKPVTDNYPRTEYFLLRHTFIQL